MSLEIEKPDIIRFLDHTLNYGDCDHAHVQEHGIYSRLAIQQFKELLYYGTDGYINLAESRNGKNYLNLTTEFPIENSQIDISFLEASARLIHQENHNSPQVLYNILPREIQGIQRWTYATLAYYIATGVKENIKPKMNLDNINTKIKVLQLLPNTTNHTYHTRVKHNSIKLLENIFYINKIPLIDEKKVTVSGMPTLLIDIDDICSKRHRIVTAYLNNEYFTNIRSEVTGQRR